MRRLPSSLAGVNRLSQKAHRQHSCEKHSLEGLDNIQESADAFLLLHW